MFPDDHFRHAPEDFTSTPRTKPRKTINKENPNVQSREDHTTEKEKTMTIASKQVKLDFNMLNHQEVKPKEFSLFTFQVTVD